MNLKQSIDWDNLGFNAYQTKSMYVAKFDFDEEALSVTTGNKVNLAIQHTGGGFFTPFGDDGTGISLGGDATGDDPVGDDMNLPFVVAQSSSHPRKVYFFVGNHTGSFLKFNADKNILSFLALNVILSDDKKN